MRYTLFVVLNLLANVIGYLLAPVVVLFASPKMGWCDNRNDQRVEPRLPDWLSWFQTPDNSLYGDYGWRTEHSPVPYQTYWAQVRWLQRNKAYGFAWSVLACDVAEDAKFDVRIVKGDLTIERNGKLGEFYIQYGDYWQHKKVVRIGNTKYTWATTTGWLLDPYVKNPATAKDQPKALFKFAPRIGYYHEEKQ